MVERDLIKEYNERGRFFAKIGYFILLVGFILNGYNAFVWKDYGALLIFTTVMVLGFGFTVH